MLKNNFPAFSILSLEFLLFTNYNLCFKSIYDLIEIMISLLGDKEALVKLGESVHQERLRRNLPQAHLAKIAGVSLPTYRKIEKGDGRIEFRHVVKVLAILGFAEALGDLVPLTPLELRIADLVGPKRKHASPSKNHEKTT